MNNIEELVYVLHSPVFDYTFVDAHDLMRATWCRPMWVHGLSPGRIMKQNDNCETLLWLLTHHIMRMISCAWHDVGVFFDCIFHGCRPLISLQSMEHATVRLWISAVLSKWLIAQHIVHISSSAWHCMCTSCTFLRVGKHHTILVFQTQTTLMIVFWV